MTDESIKKLGRKQTGVVKVIKIKKLTEKSLSNGVVTKKDKKSAKLKKLNDKNNLLTLLRSNGDGGDEFGSGISNW